MDRLFLLAPILIGTFTTALAGAPTAGAGVVPSIGACCVPLGICFTKEPIQCAAIDGVYQGDGTTCETTECPAPTTTTTTSTTTSTLPTILCGDANDDEKISAPDALLALKTSVGTAQCIPERCDYNGNGVVQASDALFILKVAVGQSIEPHCTSTTTTTTTTITTTSTTTTTLFACGECTGFEPSGSYIASCGACSVSDCKLSCYCAGPGTDPIFCKHAPEFCNATELDLRYCKPLPGGSVDNTNGNLTCTLSCPAAVCGGWNPDPAGSYKSSCITCSVTDCSLSCFCQKIQSGYRDTTIDLNDCDPAHDLGNNDGYLTCTPN